MSININKRFENSPLVRVKDNRKIYAFYFTGTDKNISKIVRTFRPLFEDFIISNFGKDDFYLIVEYAGYRNITKINIGEWVLLRNKEGEMVANIVTDKAFKNDYEVLINKNKAFKLTDMDYEK